MRAHRAAAGTCGPVTDRDFASFAESFDDDFSSGSSPSHGVSFQKNS